MRTKRRFETADKEEVEGSMTKTTLAWLSDVYTRYGWLATLVCLVVIVALIVGVCWLFGISPAAMATWLGIN